MIRLPLRWSGALPAGDLAPLNCLVGGEGRGDLPAVTGAGLGGVQIPRRASWPSVRLSSNGAAEAGPTGAPWIHANGWRIRMLQARDAARPVWIDTQPPPGARAESFPLAVADAMAYGGAWIVTHTQESWPQVRKALQFFLDNERWQSWKPAAALAIVSSFTGSEERNGGECLNLLARRQVGYSLAAPGDVDALADSGAAFWVPESAVPMEKYLPWVRGGRTLLVLGDYSRNEGKGRIIGLAESWKDSYGVVAGVHRALTRRTDVLRLWNAASFNSFYQIEPGGRRGVVHLVNYASNRSSGDTTLWLARPWKRAFLTTFEKQTPLNPVPSNGGIEIPLPSLGVYAAIEVEG